MHSTTQPHPQIFKGTLVKDHASLHNVINGKYFLTKTKELKYGDTRESYAG